MKIQLADNLRALRKARRLTQEQLAEALGVTVGAVYKWESGRSTPELDLLVELADLFEVSVDALLGYQYRSNDRKSTVERLNAYKHSHAPNALADAEKALKRYPNNFEVVYASAVLYFLYGLDGREEKRLRRALALMEQACLLIDQNRDESISEMDLRRDMASIYLELDESAAAIRILKENNPCGLNHARIGLALAQSGQYDEAVPYLSEALLDSVVNQFGIAGGFGNVYSHRGDWQSLLELMQWLLGSLELLKRPGAPNAMEKAEANYWMCKAQALLHLGRREEARDALRRARAVALAFDANPTRDAAAFRFVQLDKPASGYDNLGGTAMEAAESQMTAMEEPELAALWREVKDEGSGEARPS